MVELKKGYIYARAMHTSIFSGLEGPLVSKEDGIFMARFLHHDFIYVFRRQNHWILAFFWIIGLSLGVTGSFFAGPSYFYLMRSCFYGTVSIVRLLFVLSLPFLLSALAVFLSGHWLIFLIAFLKGFVFSFVSLGIISSFGSAGWLIRLFLCFSDLLTLPVLYWFWIRCLNCPRRALHCDLLFAASQVCLIASIDFRLITPFWAGLINL